MSIVARTRGRIVVYSLEGTGVFRWQSADVVMEMRFLLRGETVGSVNFNGGCTGEDGRVKFARQQLGGCSVPQPYDGA